MTTTTRNEAAERLREWIRDAAFLGDEDQVALGELDEALAAERRATVERIRERLLVGGPGEWARHEINPFDLQAILDEEAAR